MLKVINFVEIELAGDLWTISWNTSRTNWVKTTGKKYGLAIAEQHMSIKRLTACEAYDISMRQLEMLKNIIYRGMIKDAK